MSTHEESNIRVRLRGGASIVHTKPLFSLDSKWIFCASGEIIKVFSITSGECLHTLKGHKGTITTLKLNPHNQFQFYSASLDGSVRKWEATDGVLLKTYSLSGPLLSLMLAPDCFYATKMISHDRNDVIRFSLENIKSGQKVQWDTVMPSILPKTNCVSLGANGSYVASVNGKFLNIYSAKTKKIISHHAEKETPNTCLACHPTQHCVATGNEAGRILIWYNIFSSSKATREVRHWHALPVLDLHFSTEGSYLLSGGEECVLVKWQHGSTYRDTLPRLGAPLLHVTTSPDGTHYATSHADNAIQIISSQFRIVQHFQGLTRGHLDEKNKLRTDLMMDPRSKALVLNGRPGHLQFYNIHADMQLFNLDIVAQNYISPDNVKRPLVYTEVENAAFDEAGDWLATVERRDDGKTAPEMKLKFWMYCSKKQGFVLNTVVDLPHDKAVNTLKFRPACPDMPADTHMAVTSSDDGKFKLWTLVDDTDIYRENTCWTCDCVGYYRDEPAGAADFSEDGSMLAVAFGYVLTLWDPECNRLSKSFTLPSWIRHMLFGQGSCAHLLLVATETQLMCWNLLTMAVEWSENMTVSFMLAQPHSSNVAVFRENNSMLVIAPSSPDRIFLQTQLSQAAILSAIFVPAKHPPSQQSRLAWQRDQQLFFINSRQELLTLIDSDQEEEADKALVKLTQDLPSTAFSRLLAEKRTKAAAVQATQEEQQKLQPTQFIKELVDSPANVMPPVDSLCLTFLQTLMLRPTSSREKITNKSADSDSSDSDSDDEDDDDKDDSSDSDSDAPTKAKEGAKSSEHEATAAAESNWTDLKGLEQITDKTFSWMAGSVKVKAD